MSVMTCDSGFTLKCCLFDGFMTNCVYFAYGLTLSLHMHQTVLSLRRPNVTAGKLSKQRSYNRDAVKTAVISMRDYKSACNYMHPYSL